MCVHGRELMSAQRDRYIHIDPYADKNITETQTYARTKAHAYTSPTCMYVMYR